MDRNFFKGIFIGLLLGGGLGLLFAPKSGRETREKIGETVNDFYERIFSGIRSLKPKAKDSVENLYSIIFDKYRDLEISEGKKAEVKRELARSLQKIQDLID